MARELQTLNEQNKLALWAKQVNACRSSGRTVKDWCKESGISEQTYFSMIQTAIENGLDPYRYLTWLLKTANNADLKNPNIVESLLP